MTLYQIYQLINFVSLKENNGNLFKIYEMNIAIKGVDSIFLTEQLRKNEQYQDIPTVKQSVLAGRIVNEALSVPTAVGLTTGSGNIPTDYAYFKSAMGQHSGIMRDVELVTEEEKNYRMFNKTSKPISRNPICTINGSTIRVLPKTMTSIDMVYYKYFSVPYLDWYTDSNDYELPIAEGGTVTLGTDETGSDGQTVVSGVAISAVASDYIELTGDYTTHFTNATTFAISGSTGNDGTYTIDSVTLVAGNTRIAITGTFPDLTVDGTVGSVVIASQTVELDYDKDLHLDYAWKIMSMLGIRINFPLLTQYAEQMEQKQQ